jgi:dTMP kinase
MLKNNYPGKFIVIEGLDGSGKTVQIDLLVDYLKQKGKKVFLTKAPAVNLKTGKKIKQALTKEISINPLELQELFAENRKEHLEIEIIPALKQGNIVVSHRYAISGIAYGTSVGLNIDLLLGMNDNFILPDLTLIIDVPAQVCLKRIEERGEPKDFFEELEKLKKVREAYKKIPDMFENVMVVDGDKKITEVFEEIKKIIEEKIL